MTIESRANFILVISFLLFGSNTRMGALPSTSWLSVPHAKLCVTEGVIEQSSGNRMSVNVPKMRAFVTIATTRDVEAHFTYLGQTAGEKPLGSGEMRRQFGLKLRAQDPCNLVYAMWRIEPESKLVVSVKSNPGQHDSAECGNRGYRNIKPAHSSRLCPICAPVPPTRFALRCMAQKCAFTPITSSRGKEMLGLKEEVSTDLLEFVQITPDWNSNSAPARQAALTPIIN
ncbi:MAG TPA: hypothetical protein VIX91_15845 [Candidatus Acidoferrum sp.]